MSRYLAPVRVVFTQQQARALLDLISDHCERNWRDADTRGNKRERRIVLAAHGRITAANVKAHAKDREAGRT